MPEAGEVRWVDTRRSKQATADARPAARKSRARGAPAVNAGTQRRAEQEDAEPSDVRLYQVPTSGSFISNAALLARQLQEQEARLEAQLREHQHSPLAHTEEECDGDGASDELQGTWELVDDDILEHLELSPEVFGSPGERIAFAYWFNHLSGVLPAYDSADNPYRRISKLALASPVLLDTIISLATEYMYCHGHAAPNVVLQRHDKALASLRQALVSCDNTSAFDDSGSGLSPKQATLAAVLLQIANLVFIGGSGVDVHLACAMHFLQDLGYIEQPVEGFVARLLVQRFAMLDVTVAILRHRRPHLPVSFWLFLPEDKYDRTIPSFREMTGCPQPVLGFLARLANLAADLRENPGAEGRYDVLRRASTLDTDMRIYARSKVTLRSMRPTKTRHLDNLSQCFYWSAHLILQRLIYRDSPGSWRVQQTVEDLVRLIKSMPPGCGPDSSLPFPFYISSREAVTTDHRAWVRERNNMLKQVYPARIRDSQMALLEDIWRVIDENRLERETWNDNATSVIVTLERSRDFCLF
ncbi:hypothetical protein NKR23_g8791 [Pleurostoma richardsiae]|uniref:Uncharacterized protein n=1 Tax=Pleurostoma richardsiae TaxID=41990 RepID=A0AA38R714_9PEZI|nr:hypothetical protein NKR23_g8791 [Pleurostoma richardsiae]